MKQRCINGIRINGTRVYERNPSKLISWIQQRCSCGRFLGKHSRDGINKCHKCFFKNRKEYMRKYMKVYRDDR